MKNILAFSAVMLMAAAVFAQGMQGRRGQHRMMYDQSAVVTISGTIQKVDTISGRRGNFHMIQLVVKDSTGTYSVNVAPSTYLDEQKISFKEGDAVVITGAKMQFNGNDFIMAAKIVDGGKTITLRDENGRPVWFRGGMR